MIRIMILDDEPNIVDGLYVLLEETFGEQVDLKTAYYPEDALDILRYSPMDILILDIKMPQKSGIEMLEWIDQNRPTCRAILLSGYSDFQYVQAAMRYRCCVGYVLKIQEDEKLLEEIRRQIAEIGVYKERRQIIQRAQEKLYITGANLQDSAVRSWIFDPDFAMRYGIPELAVNVREPFLPVLASIRFSDQGMPLEEAIQCVDDVFAEVATAWPLRAHMTLEDGMVMWILQGDEKSMPIERVGEYAKITLQYVEEQLDCLHLSILFVTYAQMCTAGEIEPCVRRMKTVLNKNDDGSGGVLVLEGSEPAGRNVDACVESIKEMLDQGDGEGLSMLFEDEAFCSLYEDTQTRLKIVSILLERAILLGQGDEQMRSLSLRIASEMAGGEGARQALEEMAQMICDIKRRRLVKSSDRLVQYVMDYIEKHIADSDLSLTSIALKTTYNQVYLSRVIKQKLGKGVLEIINERRFALALEMLLKNEYTVQEITQKIGFQSPSYFSFFFRKYTGMTPMQYVREHMNRDGHENGVENATECKE